MVYHHPTEIADQVRNDGGWRGDGGLLRDAGKIRRIGSNKTGYWEIIE